MKTEEAIRQKIKELEKYESDAHYLFQTDEIDNNTLSARIRYVKYKKEALEWVLED